MCNFIMIKISFGVSVVQLLFVNKNEIQNKEKEKYKSF